MFNSPLTVLEKQISIQTNKTNLKTKKIIYSSILAGIFISIGASASMLGSCLIENQSIAKLVAGTIFPVGLILVVTLGAELFTGDILMTLSLLDKKTKLKEIIKILSLVYLGNLIGSLFFVFLNYMAGTLDFSNNALAVSTIKLANTKVSYSFIRLLVSGILCNVIVCLAALAATSSKDITGKVMLCFFPILAFVILGFEHSVANMYYLPSALLAVHNQDYLASFTSLYPDISLANLNILGMIMNLIPVTIGNIMGGVIVSILFYKVHQEH